MKQCVFDKNDYNSGDGMLTSVWGPNLWHVLHTMSFNYPVNPTEQDKIHYMNFIKSLQYVLPCRYCRINLTKNFKKHKLTKEVMASRDSFSRWLYKLHNYVNKMLAKSGNISYTEVRERYEHFRSRCVSGKEKTKMQKGGKIKSKKIQKGGKKEKGCTKPLYGVKSMSVISIVPRRQGIKSLTISPKCRLKK
tara:strand:- start:311 stop:886 length:576 start_codon:yes stop_codon:yes gene_type:complete